MVNLGGGFPTKYLREVPAVEAYGRSIFRALRKHFGNRIPETIIEPGRGMVGNAGVIEAEVVLVSKKSEDDQVRWVYLDIGKFGGLAETMDESIRYPIRTPRDGDEVGPCVLAGPTCNSADVLYEKQPYDLPISLEIGDKVLIEGTGAYTATYASVAFNGFAPLRTYPHLNKRGRAPRCPGARLSRFARGRAGDVREEERYHGHHPRRKDVRRRRARSAARRRPTARRVSPRRPSGCAKAGCRRDGLSLVAIERGRVVGTVRLWHVTAGPAGRRCCSARSRSIRTTAIAGIGSALMRRAIARARLAGHRAILLVGDAPYYGRFGFSAAQTGALWLPGPYERDRLLGAGTAARPHSPALRAD